MSYKSAIDYRTPQELLQECNQQVSNIAEYARDIAQFGDKQAQYVVEDSWEYTKEITKLENEVNQAVRNILEKWQEHDHPAVSHTAKHLLDSRQFNLLQHWLSKRYYLE
jgi:hypothetical protein